MNSGLTFSIMWIFRTAKQSSLRQPNRTNKNHHCQFGLSFSRKGLLTNGWAERPGGWCPLAHSVWVYMTTGSDISYKSVNRTPSTADGAGIARWRQGYLWALHIPRFQSKVLDSGQRVTSWRHDCIYISKWYVSSTLSHKDIRWISKVLPDRREWEMRYLRASDWNNYDNLNM